MIFSYNKCCVCPRDIEVYLPAVFLCLAAALPHHNIVINFITDLPSSLFRRNVYDSILVITNRYSKIVVLIPYTKDVDTIDLAETIKSNVFRYYGLFKSYVSDRGSLFTSD